MEPTGYSKYHYYNYVTVKPGENKLEIKGTGKSDGYGLTIDNFKLVNEVTGEDLLVNGDFEQPNVGKSWKNTDNLPGWEGSNTEVGWGKIYNDHWDSGVVELDSSRNFQISQKWNFGECQWS
mgnify:CR=1 FL=1